MGRLWFGSRTVLAALALVFLALASSSFADEFTSESFRVPNPVGDSFGALGTSTSFSSLVSGGQTVAGEATSTSFVLQMGFLYFDSSEFFSQNWRWYDDAENTTPVSPLADENVAPINIDNGNAIKLRLSVAEADGIGSTGMKLRLQFSTTSDFSYGSTFVSEIGNCSGSSEWCYADGGGTDTEVIPSALLSDSDTCSGGAGAGCGTHNEFGTTTSAFTHLANATAEYEFTITASGALTNTAYFFRVVALTSSSTVAFNTGESYPSLATGGSSLSFTIDGLESGTTTEGITTDITTTPTSVPFGALALNDTTFGAQRLTVSTSGTDGYKVYVYERQEFLGNTGATIDPVIGTNATPLSWTLGCPAGVDGCFGYHSGEDVLEGGSTRFAADNTYARFDTDPYEVGFSDEPTNSKMTDIVFQVEARDEQEAGEYATNIVYIVTPVF